MIVRVHGGLQLLPALPYTSTYCGPHLYDYNSIIQRSAAGTGVYLIDIFDPVLGPRAML